jgi:hypothetical protein
VREFQQKALSVKSTFMIVLLDISGGEKVHAPNKREVGLRLGAAALNEVYGKKDALYQGPFLKSMEIKDGEARSYPLTMSAGVCSSRTRMA